jgi:hypothetical protein
MQPAVRLGWKGLGKLMSVWRFPGPVESEKRCARRPRQTAGGSPWQRSWWSRRQARTHLQVNSSVISRSFEAWASCCVKPSGVAHRTLLAKFAPCISADVACLHRQDGGRRASENTRAQKCTHCAIATPVFTALTAACPRQRSPCQH